MTIPLAPLPLTNSMPTFKDENIQTPILTKQKVRSGILIKGLCMALLPLLFNSVLILILNNSLSRAEALIDSSRRQMTVVHKLTHAIYVVTELYLGGNNAMMNGGYNFFGPLINQGWTVLKSDLAEVSANITPDAAYIKFRDGMNSLIDRQQAIFIKSENRSLGRDNLFVKLRRVNEWISIGGKQSRLLHQMQEIVREKYLHSINLQQKDQKLVEAIALVAIILNLLLAIFLIKMFERDFSGRIEALSKMAQKLPLNEPINETISGTDELQEIGVELAKVSWRLADITEHRRSLMQMMAHDVRSPLMAAEISIATLHRFLETSLSDQGTQNLAEASQSLANCLLLVNDLLLLESLENGEWKPDLKTCRLHKIMASIIETTTTRVPIKLMDWRGNDSIEADREKVSLVLKRMLRSAVARAPQDSIVEITYEQLNGLLRLTVQDQGTPLTSEEAGNLFDKVAQASCEIKDEADSLGLSIAVPIVKMHGGSIYLKPLNQGNLLCLELPSTASSPNMTTTETLT